MNDQKPYLSKTRDYFIIVLKLTITIKHDLPPSSLPLKNSYMAPKLKATTNDQNRYFPKTRDDFTMFLK